MRRAMNDKWRLQALKVMHCKHIAKRIEELLGNNEIKVRVED